MYNIFDLLLFYSGRIMKGAMGMDKYACALCGYVYDPGEGDPEHDIDPGIPFEELPDDWLCPVCGAGKDEFEKMDE